MTLILAQICLYLEILLVHILLYQSSSALGTLENAKEEDANVRELHDSFYSGRNVWDISLEFLSLNARQSISGNHASRMVRSVNTSIETVKNILSFECGNSGGKSFKSDIRLKTSELEIIAVDLFQTAVDAAIETANLINSMHKNGGQTEWPKFYEVVLGNTVENIDRFNHKKDNDNNNNNIANNNNKKNILQFCIVTKSDTVCAYVSNASFHHPESDNFSWYYEELGEKYVTKHNEFDSNGSIIEPINRTTSYPHVVKSDGKWSAEPYLDCSVSGLWIITYAVPFIYGNTTFGGSWSLSEVPVNVAFCLSLIKLTTVHCCDVDCVFIPGNGFILGSYMCKCNLSGENLTVDTNNSVESRCRVVENRMEFRTCLLALQMLCVAYVLILIIMVRRFRRLKVLNYDSPWMIIVVLIGAILLYSELIPMYFDSPSNKLCFLQRWLREVGYAVTFGTLVLKVYRKLAIFQTRSASRVLVRDRDLIKWILVIIFVMSGYLAVWTVSTMEDTKYCGYQMVVNGSTTDGRQFRTCDVEWWDSVLGIIEFAFLMFGLYLCYLVRSAPSEFNEIKYVTLAIFDEAFVSLILYIIRNTLLVLVYKLLHDDHFRERMNSRIIYDVKCQASVKRNPGTANDYTFGADVREELRRLYTQLEIYKTHSMKENNPHIPSKKRSAGKRWRDTRKLSRGPSLRTQSYHSESEIERSSDVGKSTESLSKPLENMCEGTTRMHSLDRGETNRRKFTLDRNDPAVRKKNNVTSSLDKADASFSNNRTCKL
ncbi:probable G-protein coupled receptor 158 [Anneissia japonica]|uniref:probable G-protein coupled receptor 158 n=1 Tax=Anneissia japonica TaxID=1529436 RepID=UPI001425684E|nr:probable G-protein coupled receptor 158 [Anneissia japonica]